MKQLKTIPKEWEIKKISDLLDYERPDKYIVQNTNYLDKGTLVLTANKSFVLGYTDEDFGVYKNVPVIIFDDFTTDSKYVDFPFKIKSSAIKILKAKNKNVNLKFVYEKMKSIKFPTGNHKRYYISEYQNLKIAIPQIKAQQKIADILSAVDEDIEKTDRVIEKTKKLKKGLMQKLLTKGTNKKIREVCQINPQQINPKKESEKTYNYIDISSIEDFRIKSIKAFTGDKAPSRARRLVKENDVIISTVRPNLRGFSFIRRPFNYYLCSTGFCVLRCGQVILPKYLYYIILQDKFVNYLMDKTTGSNYPAVNSCDIGEFILKLPSTKQQKQIAEILSEVDNKIEINKSIKDKLTQLKKGLMQDLLGGRVRVK